MTLVWGEDYLRKNRGWTPERGRVNGESPGLIRRCLVGGYPWGKHLVSKTVLGVVGRVGIPDEGRGLSGSLAEDLDRPGVCDLLGDRPGTRRRISVREWVWGL